MALRAVIFDLDGTLIHSKIDFKEMKRRSIGFLEASGVEKNLLTDGMLNYDIERLAAEDLRRKGVSEEEIGEILREVGGIMSQVELEALKDVTLVEGVTDTLKGLKKRGAKTGIITRSCREYTQRVLKEFGLEKLIDAFLARDDVSKPKPDPEHLLQMMKILGSNSSETILVGDHHMDALCAKNAGIKFCLIPASATDLSTFKEHNYKLLKNIREVATSVILQTKRNDPVNRTG